MKEYDLFIPLYYNDGTPIEPVKVQILQARLLEFFNGVTFFPQPNQGLWQSGGVTIGTKLLSFAWFQTRFVRHGNS